MKCTNCGIEGTALMGYRKIDGEVLIRRDERLCPECAERRVGADDVYLKTFKERTRKRAR